MTPDDRHRLRSGEGGYPAAGSRRPTLRPLCTRQHLRTRPKANLHQPVLRGVAASHRPFVHRAAFLNAGCRLRGQNRPPPYDFFLLEQDKERGLFPLLGRQEGYVYRRVCRHGYEAMAAIEQCVHIGAFCLEGHHRRG